MDDNDLFLGDCLEKMQDLPDASIDLILTDPPYGTTACKWDSIIPLEPMWNQIWRIAKPHTPVVLFSNQPFTSFLITSEIKHFKYIWTWEKTAPTNFLNSKKMPLRLVEDICVFYKKQPVYNPQMLDCKPYKYRWSSGSDTYRDVRDWRENGPTETDKRQPVNVLVCGKDKEKLHPTQKPIALLEYLIKTYSNVDDTVLDFTMGSGSTGVASKNLRRHFIGMELDKTYFDIATKRLGTSILC